MTVILLTWPTLCHSSLGGQWVRAVREPDADPKEFFQGFPAPARVYMEQVVEEQTRAGRKRADTLARLLEAAEDLGTIRTTLRAVDFAGVEPLNSVQVAVDTYLTTYGQPNDARLVVDFTEQIRDPTATLDARDESLRAQSTDFGNFVADCARRHFRSDLAIVNAGSFRLDDFVPPAITLRILRETFLYDEANALVEVTIPISACEAVLKHGITKRGSGAFLQISCGEGVQVDPRTGAVTVVGDQRDVRVAVSSFLLTSAEDEDGYLAALQQRGHGPDQVSGWLKGLAGKRGVGALPLIAAALRLVRGAEQPHGSVVDAVVQQAAEVRYDPSVRLTSSADVDALVFDTEQLRRPMDVLLKQRQTHYHALEAITEETKERARRITGADFSSEVCDAAGALRETLVRLINDRGVDHVRQILDRVLKDERGFRDSENARTG